MDTSPDWRRGESKLLFVASVLSADEIAQTRVDPRHGDTEEDA